MLQQKDRVIYTRQLEHYTAAEQVRHEHEV